MIKNTFDAEIFEPGITFASTKVLVKFLSIFGTSEDRTEILEAYNSGLFATAHFKALFATNLTYSSLSKSLNQNWLELIADANAEWKEYGVIHREINSDGVITSALTLLEEIYNIGGDFDLTYEDMLDLQYLRNNIWSQEAFMTAQTLKLSFRVAFEEQESLPFHLKYAQLDGGMDSLLRSMTGSHLIGEALEANWFRHAEVAEKIASHDW